MDTKIRHIMFRATRRLLFLSWMASFGLVAARGQSSVPPLPTLPLTLTFSNCDAGVTFKVTITDWLRDGSGKVDPLAAMKVATNVSVSYTYLFWVDATMTVGPATQVATGARLPDGSVGRPLGALSILYSNIGSGIPASTSFTIQTSNASGLGVGAGQATANQAWSATLYGVSPENLLPNGLLSPLPPISALAPPNTFIQGDGKLLARPVTSYGACAASPLADLLKLLGDLLSPGKCPCGDPIDIATGNLFEQVDDYQTDGANKLRFTRYYNSQATSATFAASLGPNWRTIYDRYIRIVSPTSAIAERQDGRQLTFTLSGSAWACDSDVDLKLTNSGSTWTLTDSNDAVETYTTAGSQARLQTIRARNGYTQTLQYNSSNQVASITDSFNRSLFFTYNAALLQTVDTPDAQTFTYGFTGGRLTSIGYSTTPATSQTYLYENTALPSALTGIVDENGNRYVTWSYDAKGRTASSQHAGGADLTTISYNDTDGSRTVANALGAQSVYKFTTLQKVLKVSEIDRLATATTPAATKKFGYDANGYVASQTDWNGNLTNYVNDAHGQPVSITEAAGTPQARTTTFTYHPTLHVPLRVVEPGLTTTFTYDAAGNLLTRTVADTTTTTVPYSTAGQTRTWTYTWSNFLLASIQKPRALGATQLTYDNSGALTATTNAAGQTTQVTQHLPGGLPQTVVDANGVTTQLTYDARLRLLTRTVITAAGALTTSHNYDAAGNLLSVTRPDGSTLANTFDGAHRLTGVTDLFNQSVAYTLDALGDRTKSNILDAGGNVQGARSATFDALGRMRQDIGGAGQTTAYAYDGNGNALRIIDPLSRVTQRAFDARNRLVRITDPAQGALATAYDAQDRPTSVTDPNGGVTTYVYDGFDEIIQRVSPDSGTTVYRYDPDGNLTQRVDAAGAITNYTYDALDRVLTTTYPGDASLNVTYTYDQPASPFGIGRLTTLADAAGTMTRSYDERGNVLSETRVIAAVTSLTTYTYDAASRIASITYPSGWTAIYSRDLMGRVTAVTAQAPGGGTAIPILTGVGYQPFGPFNALTFANGVTETRTFDLDYRLTNLADAGSSAIQNLNYSYDAANNVSAIADAVAAANSQTFSYDALNRLTAASGGYGAVGYTYDGVGNRLTEKAGASTTTYTYTPRTNQLASVSAGGVSQTIGYAKTGDINSFNPAAGTITNLTYNQAGRLATVTAGSNPAARYTYDAFGQRLVKTGASVTLYEYDLAGRLIEETDGQGNPLADYIYLDSLPVATLSSIDGQIYFLHDDRLGTPQAATDSGQNVVWSAAYGPFGEMSTVPGLIVQNLRLPGQEYDADTGLYHNGFRDYAPRWGRYLQSDPAGLAGGMNTYAYVNGNPVKLVDPLGLFDKQYWSDSWNELRTIANQDLQDAESWAGVQWAGLKARGPIGYLEHEFPTATSCVIALKKAYDEDIKPWLNPILDLLTILKGVAEENPVDVLRGIANLKKDTQGQPPAPAPAPATPPPATPAPSNPAPPPPPPTH